MPWRYGAGSSSDDLAKYRHLNIWLRFNIRINSRAVQRVVFLVMQLESPALSLVVWTLKREVRASGECLGMYRR
jgi:hypothetical protein